MRLIAEEPLTTEGIARLIQRVVYESGSDPNEVVIGTRDWIELRKRDDATRVLEGSLQAAGDPKIFNVPLQLDPELNHGIARDADGRTVAHLWPGGDAHSGDYESCLDHDCVVRHVMTE